MKKAKGRSMSAAVTCGADDGPERIVLDVIPMEGFGGGFRQEWCRAKMADGTEIGIDAGAGVGNPLLTLWVKRSGDETRYFTASMKILMEAWAKAIAACESGGAQ